jgi:hypothetical protein
MARRRHHSSRLVEDLRLTIDCLPVSTRRAMLEGVRNSERIIAGAYVDGEGGVCPMLAAHIRGARTSFLSFARSWDRFTHARRGARCASRRELNILVGQLEASLLGGSETDLDRAIDEHRALLARRHARAADPAGEIIARRLRARRYRSSPGRVNITSGTMHAGETRSR